MKFIVDITETAAADLKSLPRNLSDAILRKIESLRHGVPGSAKRLWHFEFGYRIRLGDYRILFDLTGTRITIQRILHRRHAYASSQGKKRKGQH